MPSDVALDEELVPLEDLALLERSFVSGDRTGQRLVVRYFQRKRDRAAVAKVRFGPLTEGPPGHAHGGSMAAVLDEIMGLSCWMAGHMVVAAKLSTEFRKMLPLETEANVVAWVEKVDGRKVITRGRITSGAGNVLHAEAEGLFVMLDEAKVLRLWNR